MQNEKADKEIQRKVASLPSTEDYTATGKEGIARRFFHALEGQE